MGQSGLARAGEELRRAMAEKRDDVPHSLLAGTRSTPTTGINFPEKRAYNRSAAFLPGAPRPPGGFRIRRVPYRFYVLHVEESKELRGVVSFDFRCL